MISLSGGVWTHLEWERLRLLLSLRLRLLRDLRLLERDLREKMYSVQLVTLSDKQLHVQLQFTTESNTNLERLRLRE